MVDQNVTLGQAAAMVSRSKHTLRKREDLPAPDVTGDKGKANYWRWSRIRPWLEKRYGRELPEDFPGAAAPCSPQESLEQRLAAMEQEIHDNAIRSWMGI